MILVVGLQMLDRWDSLVPIGLNWVSPEQQQVAQLCRVFDLLQLASLPIFLVYRQQPFSELLPIAPVTFRTFRPETFVLSEEINQVVIIWTVKLLNCGVPMKQKFQQGLARQSEAHPLKC